MQMREATENRGQAEDETNDETDEVEGVHNHCVRRLLRLFVLTDLGCAAGGGVGT
jgi:hypothetical protein